MGSDAEVVREFYDAVNRWLAAYFADPSQELARAAGVDDVFDRLSDDAEWDWLFSPDTLTGREQLLTAAGDFASTVSDWRIEIEEITSVGGGRVLLALRVLAQGTGSGTPIAEPVWSVVFLRDGRVARLADYGDPDEARRAARAPEGS